VVVLVVATGCSDDPTGASRSQDPAPDPAPDPWLKTLGSIGYDESHDIAVDPMGNVFVTGALSAPVDFGGQIFDPADGPVFVVKFNPSGEFLWVKHVWGANPDGPLRLGTDKSGGVVLEGVFVITVIIDETTITSAGGADHVFVAKLDAAGNVAWTAHDTAPYLSVGFGMATGESGGTAVTGFFQLGAAFGETELAVQGFDFFVVNFDAAGNPLWARTTGSASSAAGGEVAVDPSDNVIVAGEFTQAVTFGDVELTSAGSRDAFITKYSAAGDVLWAAQIGNENDDAAYGIVTDRHGNIYVTGRRWGTPTALWKFTSDGDLAWEADAVLADDIALDPWNNIFLSGSYRGTLSVGDSEVTSNGFSDFFVAKYDASGRGLWAVSGGASRDDRAQGLTVDRHGAPIAVVDFSESFEFAGETITSEGAQDLLIFKLE
jgi:hypothetical protein